jgi:hypothetical protein
VEKTGHILAWYLRRSGPVRGLGKVVRRVLRARQRLLLLMPARRPATLSVAECVHKGRTHIAAGRVAAAHRLAEATLCGYPESVELLDLRASTLDYLGQPGRAIGACLASARLRLAALDGLRRPPPELGSDQRIFVSGFFYSGSGAVLDWLRGFDGTAKWSPVGEMRLIKFPGGLADLAERHTRQGRLTIQDLVDHYLHLVGGKVTLVPPGVYNQREAVNRDSRKLLAHRATAGYLHACLTSFLELTEARVAGGLTGEELEAHLRESVRRALDAGAADAEADLLLVDQAVTAWRLPTARLVPPSTFVVVHRDPRDQFAEARAVAQQPGRPRTTVDSFAATYRQQHERLHGTIDELERTHGHRFIRVAFEDFVLDHAAESARLRTALDLHGRPLRKPRFVPEQSRQNIGKYVGLLPPNEAASLAAALPEFLHPRVR